MDNSEVVAMNLQRLRYGLFAVVFLAACAQPLRQLPPAPSGAGPVATAAPLRWTLDGRIAISNGRDSGSGRLHWQQDAEFYVIDLRAPISGESWRLSGDGAHAVLEGLRAEPIIGVSAEALLRRELGWELPVGALQFWLTGRPQQASARWRPEASGLPQQLQEQGWQIEYRDWFRDLTPPLPKRIVARNGKFQLRLAISRWQTDPAAPRRD